MDENRKKEIATFRFGVIHDLVGATVLSHGEKEKLIREKCARKWSIPHSDKTRISRSTLVRWIKSYQDAASNLEALYPTNRADRGRDRIMDEETALALIRLREEMPLATVKRLMTEMNRRDLVSPHLTLIPSTVYRFLKRRGLMRRAAKPEDRRRFEAETPNDLWQSDLMHGPTVEVDKKQRKTYLLAFIDDHSRLIPHAEFHLSESIASFLGGLEIALLTRGLPRKLYTDNGPAFRSKHLEQVLASLGVALIHSTPYRPQGRGKIERFFKTIRTEFLPGFTGRSLTDLNCALCAWLRDVYHQRPHGGTGQTPFERFTAHTQCLRLAPDNLPDHFRKAVRRKVAKDRTISLNGKVFEAPVPLIGRQVLILYHEHEPERIEVKYEQKSYGFLRPVDLHVNCRVKRDKNRDIDLADSQEARIYKGGRLWGRR
ncbi:MAG: DDE-type integrase/transposase/recombinase [Deltaproteobacteria bacterium]|nr:DDE-type integrase/transposase/recombinase [Deltaproteobacteria bacterium]